MCSSQLTADHHKGINSSPSALQSSSSSSDRHSSAEKQTQQPENSGVMLLLTLLFVSSAVATPLLGKEQCAQGPPYWCQNVKTASLCGAVTHCQQNVWNKPQMKSVPCDLCKEVLTVVEQLLKDNATEAEVLGYLEKACQLIPDQSLTAQCKEIVDDYYPILIGIITGELEDPGVVCGAMGLCQSQQAALAKVQAQEQLVSNEIPQVDLAQRVAPFLLNVPGLLYPKKSPKQETPNQETPKKDNGDICQDCIMFLTDIQDKVKNNKTFTDDLIEKIESQCERLGPGLADMCMDYISRYADMAIEKFKLINPEDGCSFVGFCDSVKNSVPMMKLQPAKIVPAKMVPATKVLHAASLVPATKVDLTTEKPSKPMVRVRESPQCAICEFVMKQLESMLEDQTTEEEVIHAVEKVCTLLPSSLTTQCKDLIETYGQAIIELLVQQADPKTVCTVLALCNDASRQLVVALDRPRFKAGGYCKVCKMAISYIDGILEQNATESEITEAVSKVCSFLPSAYQTECDQLVEQYEPMLIQLLLQMLDPDFVCMKLGACPEVQHRLLGTEQCSWGPAFWCKNMETATRCNAVTHCKRHVWV